MPPRFGKTQFCVIDWMARCIARNPRARFIHLSYSDELALDNSAKCKEVVKSAEFQKFWPVKIKADSDSKKKWYTEQGGGVYATAAGGQVTGFGAGSLADVAENFEDEFAEFFQDDWNPTDPNLFYGAISIDDPIKVDDAYSDGTRKAVNERLKTTILSRRNSRKTPIVISMQRLNEMDMSGYVLSGETGEVVYHLNLPALQPDGSSLWPAKHTAEELIMLRDKSRSVFMAQYQQDPAPDEGTFFKKEWFKRFRLGEEPIRLVKYGAGDYAVTEDENDWSEQAIAGFDVSDNLWFIDWNSAQVTIDKSIDTMMKMVGQWVPMVWIAESGVIRRAMEPYIKKEKQLRRIFFKNEWLPATSSKAANARGFQALASEGKVYIPYGTWGDELIEQLLKFNGKDGKRDDKVDVCGIFGRILDQAFGPTQYHDELINKGNDYDYDTEEENDWRTA